MVVAAVRLPDVESSPGSRDPTIRRFRRALRAGDAGRYRDVPVDWWDGVAEVWRPTAISRCEHADDSQTHVYIQVPDGAGTSLRRVRVDELRLSRLLTAGIARYWVARYRRLLLLTLIEHAELNVMSLAELRAVHERMQVIEALGRDVWMTAFRRGAPGEDGLVTATALSDSPHEHMETQELVLDCLELVETAAPLLALDLLRMHSALRAAAVPEKVIASHPLVMSAATLLRSLRAAA